MPFWRTTDSLDSDEYYSKDLKRLMIRLLSTNPAKRPCASEILENAQKDERISVPTGHTEDHGIIVKPKFETKLKRAWQTYDSNSM